MDLLNKILPKSGEWVIRKNTLYKQKIHLIPIAKIIDDDLWIVFDKNIYRESIEIINICKNKSINFFITTPRLIRFDHIYSEDLEEIIHNYISHLMDKSWHRYYKNKIDISDDLLRFIETYDCLSLFYTIHDEVKTNNEAYWWNPNKKLIESLLTDFDNFKRKVKIKIIKRKAS